jgi:hypothetical protein
MLALHLLQISLVYMLSRDFGGQMLAPLYFFAALLNTCACTFVPYKDKIPSDKCSSDLIRPEGDRDGDLHPHAIIAGPEHLFGGRTRWPAGVSH